jgi:Flp pilus assembly pilin Flp
MRIDFRGLVRDEEGEDLIEYGLLAAFAAGIATAAIISDPLALKPSLVNAFKKAKTALDNG